MVNDNVKSDLAPVIIEANDIGRLIYTIRGQQVMLDSDLAALYGYEVKRLNEQVKRNKERFPDDFMFQLTEDEFSYSLRSQISTLKNNSVQHIGDENLKSQIATSSWGGRRKPPYAFTEQGIYMLATILKGEVAEKQSIFIMRAFREMRHFIANNALLFEKISAVELKQLEYPKSTDEKFDRVFQYIDDHAESEQKIFFDGQIYDAFSFFASLTRRAEKEIILIDGYVDVDTLNILAKKKSGVAVNVYTFSGAPLTKKDIEKFNAEYPLLTVTKTQVFHDRFLILDGVTAYHIGASLNYAGKKCFGISLLEDPDLVKAILDRLNALTAT